MKRGFVLICLSIAVNMLFAQPKDENLERQLIAKSNIKSITQWTHRFSQGKPNVTGYKTTETHYDKNGNATEIVNYRSTGEQAKSHRGYYISITTKTFEQST